jgi:hypothetical protein
LNFLLTARPFHSSAGFSTFRSSHLQVLSRPALRRLYEGPVVPLHFYQEGVYKRVLKSMWDATQLIEFHITNTIVADNAVGLSFLFPSTYFVWRNADGTIEFANDVLVVRISIIYECLFVSPRISSWSATIFSYRICHTFPYTHSSFSDAILSSLNESVFMYQEGTVESLYNLKYWSIGLVVVPLVLLTLVVAVLVRPTV